MTTRELERGLQRLGLTRSQAREVMRRGERWRWLASISVKLFVHAVIWRTGR